MRNDEHFKELVMRHVNITENHWIWTGFTRNGTPQMKVSPKERVTGQRAVFAVMHPDIDIEDKRLMKECDEPLCVRPEHHSFQAKSIKKLRPDAPANLCVIDDLLNDVAKHKASYGLFFTKAVGLVYVHVDNPLFEAYRESMPQEFVGVYSVGAAKDDILEDLKGLVAT